MMKEVFLYYIWENRLSSNLKTTDGQVIEVIFPGYRNTDSGPDFLEAKIKIGDTIWAGHIEIHVNSSDWHHHKHHLDKAYNNIILHVVYAHDGIAVGIPTAELKGHFDESLYNKYNAFIKSKAWVACAKSAKDLQTYTWLSWFDRVLVERLENKTCIVEHILEKTNNDWDETCYRLVMKYLGLKVNNEAFETLATMLPFKTLLKHHDQPIQIEAMLMGCAGLLNGDFIDEYPNTLKREFKILKAKFNLAVMPTERWKFMRMRPSNFPTIRLSQLAHIIHKGGNIFSKIIHHTSTAELKTLFQAQASSYWDTHFIFDKATRKAEKHLGDTAIDILIINAIAPILFAYGRHILQDEYCERSLSLLEATPSEDNNIVRSFSKIGIAAHNALQSQGMIELYKNYCQTRRCIECRIGALLIKGHSPTT